MVDYGINYWANDDFIIEDGKVKVNFCNKPALIDIVKQVREEGYRGPLLVLKSRLKRFFLILKIRLKNIIIKASLKQFFLSKSIIFLILFCLLWSKRRIVAMG